MMQKFFITSSGTNIGKTFITTALITQLRARGKKVRALKPIISGYDEHDENSDTALILAASGNELSVDDVSPWRFSAPLSPDMAAAREGKMIDFDALVSFCKAQETSDADVLLIEGVGGVMVPLNDDKTVCDWITHMGYTVILVGGSYLGSISHTLSAVDALISRGVSLHTVIISESEISPVPIVETMATLARFLPKGLSIIGVPRQNAQTIMPQISEVIL